MELFNTLNINSGFISFILAAFLTATIWFWLNQFIWISHLRKAKKNLDVLKNKPTARLWEAYEKTFLPNLVKTKRHAIDFFNFASLRGAMGVFDYLPSSFIGVGVLGTFIGLTIGISGFDTTSVAAIQGSITTLLSGINTAFYTSIVGMSASLLFGFIYRLGIDRTMKRINDLCHDLDLKYYLAAHEVDQLEVEKIRTLLDEYFAGKDQDGNAILPKHMLKQIAEETSRTSEQLSHFSSDLSDGLLLSSETISAISDKMGEGFTALLTNEITPVFDNIKTAVERIGELHENDSENLIGSLKSSLGELMTNFKDSIAEEGKSEMEAMKDALKTVSESLNALPGVIQESKSNYEQILGEFQNFSASTFTSLTNKIDEVLAKATENQQSLADSTQKISERLNKTTTEKLNELTQLINNMEGGYNNANEMLTATMTKFEELVKDSAKRQELVNKTVDTLTNTNYALADTMAKFGTISTKLEEVKNAFSKSSSDLSNAQNSFHNSYKESLDRLKSTVEGTSGTLEKYSEGLDSIENKLSGVFDQMSKGLDDYRIKTKEGLENYLEQFVNQLTEGTQALNNAFSSLDDIVGGLESLIQKSNKNR